jgi:hypothetical protein
MKTTLFEGSKEDLIKVCDIAISLGFSKAKECKPLIESGQKDKLYVIIEEGCVDPLLDQLIERVKKETNVIISQA